MSAKLNTGIYALCNNLWDEKTQSFVRSDDIDILKCCIDRCKPQVEYCHQVCKDTYGKKSKKPNEYWEFRCNETCNDQRVICREGCETSNRWGQDNPFFICSKNINCWPGINPDVECIKEHKDELIKCCIDTCNDKECDKMCKYMYELMSEPREFLKQVEFAPAKLSYEDQTWEYVILSIIIGIVIFTGFVIVNRKRIM